MQPASYWIDHLQLIPHPEGGYFRETYRCSDIIHSDALPERFDGDRNASTAIYFLLPYEHISHLHKIKSDELWHFHAGGPLSLYILHDTSLTIRRLGLNLDNGEFPQVIIPANTWFGARVTQPDAYTLASCTVSPGFDFQDFEMAIREDVLRTHPQHRDIIFQLTKP
jgi:predicted cupin superfamily sugar epimerase